jgi:ribonuclease VapC
VTEIVVDTSAIVAVIRGEPDRQRFVDALLRATSRLMSAVSVQEAGMVLAGRLGGQIDLDDLDALLHRFEIEIVSHDAKLARAAQDAFLRFGKGRHPVCLNFGDCAAYALAKLNDLPLLFKGDDFSKTDIIPAIKG